MRSLIPLWRFLPLRAHTAISISDADTLRNTMRVRGIRGGGCGRLAQPRLRALATQVWQRGPGGAGPPTPRTPSEAEESVRANPRPSADAVWEQLWDEAAYQFKTQNWKTGDLQEFGIDRYLHEKVLMHKTLACGLAAQIGNKLSANESAARTYPDKDAGVDFRAIMMSAFDADASICDKVAMDIARFKVVDPAVESLLGVYLNFKGLHAVAAQRVAHHFWTERGVAGKLISRMLQSETSDVYGVDIHPGVKLGVGITIDHATGVVIGETAELGDNVYLMHDVTLGATGTSGQQDRHPKIGSNVFLGAKCTVLGNITVGDGATVAASALVNKPIPPGYTAVGVPAKFLPPRQQLCAASAK